VIRGRPARDEGNQRDDEDGQDDGNLLQHGVS
jgi:hypothetical protein